MSKKRVNFSRGSGIPWRFIISAILVLLQIVFTMALFYYAEENYIWVRIIYTAIWVVCLMFLLGRDSSASYKLPWVVVIILFPLPGSVLLLMFGNPRISKKALNRFKTANRERCSYLVQDDKVKQELEEFSADARSISNYLNSTVKIPVYKNTKSTFIESGERFFECIKEDVLKAKEYVLIESYIISNGEIWQDLFSVLQKKAKEGVKIYILYDDMGSIKYAPKNLEKQGKKLGIESFKFNPITPLVSVVHNNRDHRKIVVVDGQVAYTGGINIADEYANIISPFGRWKDCAVRMEGDAVDGFIAMFVENYNVSCKDPIDVLNFLRPHEQNGAKGFIQPFGDGPRPIDEDYIGQTLYTSIINEAKKYLYIASPYFIVDTSMLEAIECAAKRGVDVRILTPHIPDKGYVFLMTRSCYSRLIKAGVKIYEYGPGFVHSKTVLCDDKIAVVGTINFDYRSFVHNYECGAVIFGGESIFEIKGDYVQTIEGEGILQTPESARLSLVEKLLKNIIGLFAPLL